MLNYDRALAVLDAARRPGEIRSIHPYDAVEALANAGLLAPDLPEANDLYISTPDEKLWLPCGLTGPRVWTRPGGRIKVRRVEPGDLTPAEARLFALAVLAAAQYAEEHAGGQWDIPLHRTESGYPNCSTCDGGGCPDCTDPA